MKKITILLFWMLSVCITVSGQFVMRGSFTINGTLSDDSCDGKLIYLKLPDNNLGQYITIDSTFIDKNKFTLSGILNDHPKPAFVIFAEKQPTMPVGSVVIIEPGNIELSIGEKSKVGGTDKNNEFEEFSEEQSNIIDQIYDLGMDNTETEKYRELMSDLKVSTYNYLKKNMKNGIGEFFILNSFRQLDAYQVIELIQDSKPEFQNSPRIRYWMTDLMSVQPSEGDMYSDIELKDLDGKAVLLSDYIGKNKYVLIDFWASWCGPCIKEVPTLIEAYTRYKDKGFEIIGISLDDDRTKWEQTVKRLGMEWPQLSDLGGWNSEAARIYKATAIPLTFLVDETGTVIAKNLRGEMLLNTLREILN